MCKTFLQTFLFIMMSINVLAQQRTPASYIPDDDIQAVPERIPHFLEGLFVQDSAGVMERTLNDFRGWNERREFADNTPSDLQRERYLKKQVLRYIDKRFTGGLKRAKNDSALYQIARVQSTLRPSTEASISKNISLKFRAKVLRGRVIMKVKNPWIDCSTTFTLNGRVNMDFYKKVKSLNLSTRVTFNPVDMEYTAEVEKPFAKNFLARVSSRGPAGGQGSNNVVHFMYNKGF